MDIKEFSRQNRARSNEAFPTSNDWDTSDWLVALMGEVGEAANIHKKTIRGDYDKGDSVKALNAFGKELADVFAYLDLVAESVGLDLEDIVIQKWNEVSLRVGHPSRLATGDHEFAEIPISQAYAFFGFPNEVMFSDDCDVMDAEHRAASLRYTGGRRNGKSFAMDALKKATGWINIRDHVHVRTGPLVAVPAAPLNPVIGNGSIVRYGNGESDVGVLLETSTMTTGGWSVMTIAGRTIFVDKDHATLKVASEWDRVLWSSTRVCRALKRD